MKKILIFKILFFILCISTTNWNNKCWGQFVHYETFDLSNGLSSLAINDLYQDSKGYLWIATQAGLMRYNGYEFVEIGAEHKFIGQQIKKIAEDQKNRFWIVSENNTLAFIDNEILKIHPLSKSLQHLAQNRSIAALDIDAADTISIALKQHHFLKTDYTIYKAALSDSTWHKEKALDSNMQGVYWYTMNRSILLRPLPFLVGLQMNYTPNSKLSLMGENNFFKISTEGNCHCAFQQAFIYCINEKEFMQLDRQGRLLLQDTFLNPLPNIEHFYIDKKGNAWIGTMAGAYFFKDLDLKRNGKIYFEEEHIQHILQDKEGSYWIASNNTGLIFMPYRDIQVQSVSPYAYQNHILKLTYIPPFIHALSSTGMIYKVTHNTILPTYYNQSATPHKAWFYFEEKNELLLGSGRSIDVETGNSAFGWFQTNAPSDFEALCFERLQGQNILIGTPLGLMHYHLGSRQIIWHSQNIDFYHKILHIHPWNEEDYLLATPQGIFIYKTNNNTILPFPNIPLENTYIQYITDYTLEHKKGLIVATQGEGIWWQNTTGEWLNLSDENGLSSNFINKILVDKNNWWIATNKGLDKLIWTNQSREKSERIINYSTKNGLPNNGIHDILLHNENLLLATDAGIVTFFPEHLHQSQNSAMPLVHINKISINGQDTSLNDHFNLTYWQKNIQIQFLAILFKEKGNVNYRYLLEGKDSLWQMTKDKSIQYTNLDIGQYNFLVSVQNEDGSWHPQAARVSFYIQAPFWQEHWFYATVTGIIFLILIIIIYNIKKRNRLQRQLWASKQNALHAQMNPHFIFNAMNSILYFVRQNDKRQATSFLASFSILIRRILDNSKHALISLKEEIETLEKYLELEALRLSNANDHFSIQVDESLDLEKWKIPPMLIQPLIENSIVHGLVPKTEGERNLLVTIQPFKKKLRITVQDNGIGRVAAAEIRKRRNITHTSYGAQNIDERIKILNQMYKKRISIAIEDLYDTEKNALGTKIIVLIPYGLG